jgi:hypothetical protein
MKNKSVRIITVAILGIIILIPLWLYIRFQKFDVYDKKLNGNLISESGIVYEYDGSSYDTIKKEKVIGRIKGEKFYQIFSGISLYKLEGYDEQDVIYERALMWEAVYKRKENAKIEKVYKEEPSLYKQRLHYSRHDYKEVLSLVVDYGMGLTVSVSEKNPPTLHYALKEKDVVELMDELSFNFNKIPFEKALALKNLLHKWLQVDYTSVNEHLKIVDEGLKDVEAELKDVVEGKIPNYGLNGRQTTEMLVSMVAIAYSHQASLIDKKNPPYNTFSEVEVAEMENKIQNHSNFTPEQRTAMLEMLAEWKNGDISNAVQQHKQLLTWLKNDRDILNEAK